MAKISSAEAVREEHPITATLTSAAHGRLKAECVRRRRVDAAYVSLGRLLNELIMTHLPETDDEKRRKPNLVKRAKTA